MDILTFFFLVRIAFVFAIAYLAFAMVRHVLRISKAAEAASAEGKPIAPFPIGEILARGAAITVLVSALGLSFIYNPKRNMAVYVPPSDARQSAAEEGWRQGVEAETVTRTTNAPTPRTQDEVRQQTQDAARSVKDGFLALPDADK